MELPREVLEKARKEINEDPDRIQEDLKHIKDWLKKQPHLKARTDDQWLLAFLRGCKFSLARTKEKLDFFYTIRSMVPELYQNRDPLRPEIQAALKTGCCIPLKGKKDSLSPDVILMRIGAYDPAVIPHIDILKVTIMLMEISLLEAHTGIINGLDVMYDLDAIQLVHLLPQALAKKIMIIFQKTYPIRPKGLHYFNLPTFFEMAYNLFRHLLTEKMKNRMNVYTDLSEMYKKIPRKVLPNEYGGEAGSIAELTDEVKRSVEKYRNWFLEDEQFGCDEKLRPGKAKTSEELFGIEGSFRKLNVD